MNWRISHVRIFAHGPLPTSHGRSIAYEQIRERLDSALTSVFSENGKKTVLFYLTEKYSLTLEKASKNPEKLEESLTNLLGEIGWTVVKRRILQEIYGPNFEIGSISAKTSSLSDAFGFVRFLRSATGTKFIRF
ncbi:MAG: hypothetical protein ABSB53_08055 [Nitrososphaerales archaeon]|jgi:hypothetical protein